MALFTGSAIAIYLLVVRAGAAITPYLYEMVVGGAALGVGARAAVKTGPMLANAVGRGTRLSAVGMSETVALGRQSFTTAGGTTVTAVGRVGENVATHWVVESRSEAALRALAHRIRVCDSNGCGRVLRATADKFGDLTELPPGMAPDVASALRSEVATPGGMGFPNIFSEFSGLR